jgi:5-methylcytosine-specific restriction endonuclease McrA
VRGYLQQWEIRRNVPSYPPEEHATPDCDCAGKTCAGCGEVKCLGFFHRRGLFGYKSNCKLCKSEEDKAEEARKRRKEAYWRNVEIERKRSRANYQENAEQRRAYAREYRQNHLEEERAYDREYSRSERGKESDRRKHQRYGEQRIARSKAWRKANPDRALLHAQTWNANRRANKMQAEGKYTTRAWEALKAMYNYTCLCCGRQEPEITLEPDHVVPIAKGGTNTIDNIQPLCLSCNRRKGAKIIDYRM